MRQMGRIGRRRIGLRGTGATVCEALARHSGYKKVIVYRKSDAVYRKKGWS